MPRPYSEDLRWRAIQHELAGSKSPLMNASVWVRLSPLEVLLLSEMCVLCNGATIVRTFPIINHVFATMPETFLKSLHPPRGGAKTGHERAAEIEPSF